MERADAGGVLECDVAGPLTVHGIAPVATLNADTLRTRTSGIGATDHDFRKSGGLAAQTSGEAAPIARDAAAMTMVADNPWIDAFPSASTPESITESKPEVGQNSKKVSTTPS